MKPQRVEIVKDQPDFLRAVCAYPEIGLRGLLVKGRREGDHYERFGPPKGKVTVRFKATDLGYLPQDNDHRFIHIFVWKWAIKVCKKK
jgi:hypothetical protein